jgi:hypothetical protein
MALWLLLVACHLPPQPVPEGQVVLGWRLAPGMELAYRMRSTHTLARDSVVREEVWHYLVRAADADGTFVLEGHMETLDAAWLRDDLPLEGVALESALAEERARLQEHGITAVLSIDGRLDRLDTAEWSDAVSQRLLGLHLPVEPVEPGARWNETDTARVFTRLVPAGQDVTLGGTERLESLRWERRPARFPRPPATFLAAEITCEAMLRPEDARYPTVDIQGEAIWDLEVGHLATRTLTVAERGGTRPEQTGTLTLELEWVDPKQLHPEGR